MKTRKLSILRLLNTPYFFTRESLSVFKFVYLFATYELIDLLSKYE